MEVVKRVSQHQNQNGERELKNQSGEIKKITKASRKGLNDCAKKTHQLKNEKQIVEQVQFSKAEGSAESELEEDK